MRKLNYRRLYILEAGFIYCNRYELDYNIFIDEIFIDDSFDISEGSEFDNIIKDLRFYKNVNLYELKYITLDEYNSCIDKFGE